MGHEVKHTIRISVSELEDNEGKWEDLIDAYVQNAKDALTYEIFLNGNLHVDKFRRAKEGDYRSGK